MYYFDYTATSPMSKEAVDAYCIAASDFFGNPSSSHQAGIAAKKKLEECRQKIASLLSVPSQEVFFTSGGTESNAIILNSLLNSPSPGEIIVTGIEHSAILEHRRILTQHGWKFTVLPCPNGYLSQDTLRNALSPATKMVCIMKVNNVTGTIQDIRRLSETVREYEVKNGRKIHIHCDAVQALGKIPFSPEQQNIDSASFSAHKFCGPRGTGILWCRNKSVMSLSRGGGQERGLRPGTENLPGISAMTVALENAIRNLDSSLEKVTEIRKMVEKACIECGCSLISPSSSSQLSYSPYILNISVKPVPSEVFLRVMSDNGFCLSAGSACSTNSRGKAESVLLSMNIPPLVRQSSIRISFSPYTSKEEAILLCDAIKKTCRMF